MTELENILNYLQQNKDRLFREYHLRKIGVFGSIARNEQNNKSDIDLIVEFEENTGDLFLMKHPWQNNFDTQEDDYRGCSIWPLKNKL